ncbi:MAG: ribonuclease Z [Flavobacteriaceae bacterium]|nr:ribonuclease Z [Flavobacteriaceae bacterium]
MKLTILGCHSATPRENSHTSAQILEIRNNTFLIDCGEGTQVQIRKNKISFNKIKSIFISHLHGDHFYGLIGLVSTLGLMNRDTDLTVYGPKGIKEIILLQLKLSNVWLKYNLVFVELTSKSSELIYEDSKLEIHTIPLNHRVYTNGFFFKEKEKERSLNISEIKKYNEIETCDYNNLKKGKDFTCSDGYIVDNKILTKDPASPKSYAYCSDTTYLESIVPIIKNCDLLYHESTFLEDNYHLAIKTKHSTAIQAATIAKKAEVKKLLLGHFSARYKNESLFKVEAKTVFENTETCYKGMVIEL